jgi:hypothetical protein
MLGHQPYAGRANFAEFGGQHLEEMNGRSKADGQCNQEYPDPESQEQRFFWIILAQRMFNSTRRATSNLNDKSSSVSIELPHYRRRAPDFYDLLTFHALRALSDPTIWSDISPFGDETPYRS